MRYLVSGRRAAEIDRYTIDEIGVPQLVLMERAALAVAEKTASLIREPERERILVVAESGNNGGDGVAAARILHQRGYRVEVRALNGISRQTDAYRKQVELAKKAGVPFADDLPGAEGEAGSYRVIVDAIFGVGLTRDVTGVQAEAVTWMNRRKEEGACILAVDIPSGISSETGEILGTAVRADHTVTFGYEKIGMRFAKEQCGAVTVAEIGFYLPQKSASDTEGIYYTYDPADVSRLLPTRSAGGNKGSFGHVLVVAGSEDIGGASYLAAAAAYRTGCGLVKVITHENNRGMLQQLLPEAVLQTYGGTGDEGEEDLPAKKELGWADVIVLGPGLGQSETALRMTGRILREADCPVIADADAINLLAEHTEILTETAGRRPLILTPHMLEMTRLVEKSGHPSGERLEDLKKDRIRISEETAGRYGATIVLKDACTFVTDGSDGYLNSSGNDAMAKGGSGDVLTGVIAGLIAQGTDPSGAARLGVYIHGLAGDAARERLGAYSVIAGDLLDAIPDAMRIKS